MYIRVKVSPNAKKEIFKKINEDHFEISVKEKAERNMANKKVLEIVANYFKVENGKVRIVNGHRSLTKLLVVDM
ncbi:hypothetical protein CO033_02540 [Candidatus Nomurabacteria bacterium CG_4_9_14_0_2_um_filter_32_10]|uniref:Uncharacterized protein n=3 Tax=Candidatus Nomuraibacteriota TaxID=1752729 RepID=A0A2H0CHB9_9BACT|nr:MAG: hypothetical protein COW91_00790 [Candidatus Nomurabacteria bacterium CG22_combo_CG10-13_8_21_14_all_32_8]PIZ86274.1 MAG: hypothetical protein COX94_00675 [Candidatus Nomurabacteria bacterium CG_4_10_14_0_2_um_filter_33_9]PJC49251.1 MAG: hypothetical protein CO033_02540 [Candidatus Nomurabacteria bacterium CG_4_9_14_0_2_um_filter_32_10]